MVKGNGMMSPMEEAAKQSVQIAEDRTFQEVSSKVYN